MVKVIKKGNKKGKSFTPLTGFHVRKGMVNKENH